MTTSQEITASLRARATELGFAAFGVARAEALEPEGEQLRAYLAAGRHGQMGWLENTADVRIDPTTPGMVEGALSVVVLAAPYARSSERVGPAPGRIARYARGRDYHNVLSKRLRKLERWLREQGFETRHSVDSRPVLERAWAERSGLGFIGKNSCLIVPGMGSHLFLACLVTCAPLEPTPPMKRRCGDCRLCLDACPTKAFVGPRELDARRCVSYLTIEHDGVIDDELKAGVGDWLLGCDACQDVCPYNRTSLPPEAQTEPYAADPRWQERSAGDILAMDGSEYAEWAIGTPMRRPGRNRMARNAALVLGNTKQRVHLPILQQAAEDDDEAVRDAARWAVRKINDESD
ncbi:MAG: epoxyqueuosine reductase [Polyangiales bacterium]|jgi:epoxyqueuosine reductase